MSKLYLLYATLLIGMVFLLIPQNDITVGYPLSEMRVSLEYYIYELAERSSIIIFLFIIVKEEREYREALTIFFLLRCFDFADYLIGYNSPWFSIGSIPITFNIISVGVFGLVILNEIWKNR